MTTIEDPSVVTAHELESVGHSLGDQETGAEQALHTVISNGVAEGVHGLEAEAGGSAENAASQLVARAYVEDGPVSITDSAEPGEKTVAEPATMTGAAPVETLVAASAVQTRHHLATEPDHMTHTIHTFHEIIGVGRDVARMFGFVSKHR